MTCDAILNIISHWRTEARVGSWTQGSAKRQEDTRNCNSDQGEVSNKSCQGQLQALSKTGSVKMSVCCCRKQLVRKQCQKPERMLREKKKKKEFSNKIRWEHVIMCAPMTLWKGKMLLRNKGYEVLEKSKLNAFCTRLFEARQECGPKRGGGGEAAQSESSSSP